MFTFKKLTTPSKGGVGEVNYIVSPPSKGGVGEVNYIVSPPSKGGVGEVKCLRKTKNLFHITII